VKVERFYAQQHGDARGQLVALEEKKEIPHDLILRYNGEIEKAKKQKIKCLEMLFAMKETETKKGYGTAYDGFIEALKQGAKEVWGDNHDAE